MTGWRAEQPGRGVARGRKVREGCRTAWLAHIWMPPRAGRRTVRKGRGGGACARHHRTARRGPNRQASTTKGLTWIGRSELAEDPRGAWSVGPAPAGGEGLAGTLATRGGRAGDATAAAVYADRSERPSLPPPLGGPARAPPSRSRGPAAAASHAVGHPTSLSTPIPITHLPPNAPLPCTVYVCSASRVCVPECPPLGRPSY